MSLRVREFLLLVQGGLISRLPAELADFQWRIVFSNLQVYYWHPRVHYEVWPQRKTGLIEIGLHFEDEQAENYRWAERLAQRALEVQAALGPSVELEAWTPSWVRLHETLPMEQLGVELAESAAERLAALIATLQPMLEVERENVGITEAVAETVPTRRRSWERRHRQQKQVAPG